MAKSEQSLMEAETTILWNETDEPAVLWTASPKIRREWEGYGFKPVVNGGGWRCSVPKDRIAYKMLKKG